MLPRGSGRCLVAVVVSVFVVMMAVVVHGVVCARVTWIHTVCLSAGVVVVVVAPYTQ